MKFYPGCNKKPLTDALYETVYQLAVRYDKSVAVHTGLIFLRKDNGFHEYSLTHTLWPQHFR